MNNNKPNFMTDSNGYVYEIPPMEENKSNTEPPKKDDDNKGYKIGFIILVVIVSSLVLLSAYFIFFDKDEKTYEPEVVDIDYSSKVSVEEIGSTSKYNNGKDVLFKIINKNYAFISANLTVTFYDKDGNMTDKQETDTIAVSKSSNSYAKISTNYDYDRYETKISATSFGSNAKDYVNSLTKKSTKRDSNISVEITNSQDIDISNVQTCVIFYKNNTVVGFDINKLYTLNKQDTEVINISIPTDSSTRKNISFDSYEVKIFSAYTNK